MICLIPDITKDNLSPTKKKKKSKLYQIFVKEEKMS